MVTGSIARRWAKALFALGDEQGNLVGLVKEVQRAAEVWAESDELRTSVTNPLLDVRTRFAVWEAVMKRLGVTRLGRNFLCLLFDKSRLSELPAISRELQVLSDERDQRIRAEVTSAAPLADDVVSRLKVALQKSTGKAVVITARQDPALIGGIVTRVGGMMYDGSVRTQLYRVKEMMLGRGR